MNKFLLLCEEQKSVKFLTSTRIKFNNNFFQTILLLIAFFFSGKIFGQYQFPVFEGPFNVTSNYFHFVNDLGNLADVPAGNYDSFSVTVDWSNNEGALANQADLSIITSAG